MAIKTKISKAKEEQIKEAAELFEVASYYTELKRQGNQYVGFSPFNEERTPSFFVNEANGFKCFSSDSAGGDSAELIKQLEGLDYPGALSWLADFYNIDLDQESPTPGSRQQKKAAPKSKTYKQTKETSFIPEHIMKSSLEPKKTIQQRAQRNSFLKFLLDRFGPGAAERLADLYLIGTSAKFDQGSPVFWYLDHHYIARQGKVMAYHSATGKLKKEQKAPVTWVHRLIYSNEQADQFKKNDTTPLFGAHLIPDSAGPFGIVESEKTAIIASLYLPWITWLATGGDGGLTAEKLEPLSDSQIILYPDFDKQHEWEQKAEELRPQFPGLTVTNQVYQLVCDLGLHEKADLADVLLNEPMPPGQAEEPHETTQTEPTSQPTTTSPEQTEPTQQPAQPPEVPEDQLQDAGDYYRHPTTQQAADQAKSLYYFKNEKLADLEKRFGLEQEPGNPHPQGQCNFFYAAQRATAPTRRGVGG